MRNSVNFRALTISAGPGKREMDQSTGGYRRKYSVTVQSDATGISRRFTFTDSINNERSGKVGLAGDELLYAFRCFVEDAFSGGDSFEDFALEHGYEMDSRKAYTVWQACKAARRKFRDLHFRDVDPSDVLNELSERGVE